MECTLNVLIYTKLEDERKIGYYSNISPNINSHPSEFHFCFCPDSSPITLTDVKLTESQCVCHCSLA